ncbi:MAG: TIGR00304 family membrane protein [Thermoplasmata archaeon]
MSLKIWIPIAFFVAGACLIGEAVVAGEADVSLVVVFPVFTGSSAVFLLGTVLILLSFIVGFVMLAIGPVGVEGTRTEPLITERKEQPDRRTQYGGLVLIGPLPIAFGSDKNLALLMLVLGVVLLIILLGTFVLIVK